MKSPFAIVLLIASAVALFLGAGCSSVPPISAGGSYTSKAGNTYSGNVKFGTALTTDRSK